MPIGYLIDEDNDLIIENGDFKKGDSTIGHQTIIMSTEKGQVIEAPGVGVGLIDFLLDNIEIGEIKARITTQFEADGMTVHSITGRTPEELDIDATYND